MDIYIGFDWSRDSAWACFGSEKKKKKIKVKPHPEDILRFFKEVRKLWPQAEKIHVAIEAGSPLWLRLLEKTEALLYVIDGKQAKRFAESISPGGAKDDRRDAEALYALAMSPLHRGKPYSPNHEKMRILEGLASLHERVTSSITKEVQRLRQELANTMPAISKSFTVLTSEGALNFLEAFPTPQDVCALTKERFNAFLKENRFRKATQEKLWQAIQESFDLFGKAETRIQAMVVRQLVLRIRSLQESQNQVVQEMDDLYESCDESNSLSSLKGVGVGIGSVLLAEVFSKPAEHRDSAAIRSGAAPITISSGECQRPRQRMRKSVPARLRRLTYLLGVQAVRWNDWARAQYEAMRQRGKKAATAFRAVARSVLRIFQALLRDGTTFDRGTYVRRLQEKGVTWAMSLPSEI